MDAIAADGVSKTFRIPIDRPTTLKERALHPMRQYRFRDLRALDDVSLRVAEGEFFGIVGANGSGKSTLLKLLAGIYRPDRGRIEVAGRVSPLIELGVGFEDDLPARDNVVINCGLLGLSRLEALRRFDSIIEFAELEEFVDLKLKNYSSGMRVRLAFAIAIQVDASVILLDEVLAVGDARFQRKCFDAFRVLRRDGRTVLLVTHAGEAIERFCDRAMMLEAGSVAAIGEPETVLNTYRERTTVGAVASTPESRQRFGEGGAQILAAWFEDADGRRVGSCEQGKPLGFVAEVVFERPMVQPVLAMYLHDEERNLVFAPSTLLVREDRPSFEQGERMRFRISFENVLGIGRYFAGPAIFDRDATVLADHRVDLATIVVTGRHDHGAMLELPHSFTVERL
jgi:ABC-type polysaccharide/polyol phosphate transport system ATPase subunit